MKKKKKGDFCTWIPPYTVPVPLLSHKSNKMWLPMYFFDFLFSLSFSMAVVQPGQRYDFANPSSAAMFSSVQSKVLRLAHLTHSSAIDSSNFCVELACARCSLQICRPWLFCKITNMTSNGHIMVQSRHEFNYFNMYLLR